MIDHLVLATPNLAATTSAVSGAWGIQLTPGGSHIGLGTRNELAGLGGATYLEVVGPDDTQPEHSGPRPFGIDDLETQRLVAWCARPQRRLGDVIAAVAAFGIDMGGIVEMARRRPDDIVLRWQLTLPMLDGPHRGTLPFLIDWLDSPHPTSSLAHRATLLALHITHPQADLVRAVLAEIGAAPHIEVVSGKESLSAVVRTPQGDVAL